MRSAMREVTDDVEDVLAAIAYAYFQYIRPAYGKTGATALALLVFFLLVVLMGDEACRRVA